MRYSISDTAEYGDLTPRPARDRRPRARRTCARCSARSANGRFAEEWIAEMDARRAAARPAARSRPRDQPLEEVGAELRALMRARDRPSEVGRVSPDPYARRPTRRSAAAPRSPTAPTAPAARAMLKGTGFTDEDLAKPLVGVATTWIETMPCNLNQRELAQRREARASARRAGRRWSSTRSRSPTASRWAPRACARRSSRAR